MAETAITKTDELMKMVEARRVNIEKLLPPHMVVDRFIYQVRFALAKTPKLQLCTPRSIIESVLQAADLGLDPSGRLGSAWLIPYKDTCQLIPGYRGLIDLAVRSGEVKAVQGFLVRDGDAFDYTAGSIPKHKPRIPRPGEEDIEGDVYAAWGLAILPGNVKQADVMTLREINAVKARSPSVRGNRTNSPWFTDEPEMQKKTVIRRLIKTLPLSPVKAEKLAKAMEIDPDDLEKLEPPGEDLPVEEKKPLTQKIAEQLKQDPVDAEFTEEPKEEP